MRPWRDKLLSPETREAHRIAAEWETAVDLLLDNTQPEMHLEPVTAEQKQFYTTISVLREKHYPDD